MESQSLYSETPAPVVDRTSVAEDFVDIFYAPRSVFERRRDGRFALALLILVLAMVALYFATRAAMEPLYAAMADAQLDAMRRDGRMPPAMIERQRGVLEFMLPLSPIFGALMASLGAGIALWLVGKLFDSTQTLAQACMVSTYAQVPRFVLGTIVMAILAFAVGTEGNSNALAVPTSLARFAPADTSLMLLQVLNRVEPFTIWATVLLGVGLSVTGRVPKRGAYAAAAIVWLLGTLWLAASAAASG